MVVETNKIMGAEINVCANCVRVPVFIGHSEMINVQFERPISVKEADEGVESRARRHGDRPRFPILGM